MFSRKSGSERWIVDDFVFVRSFCGLYREVGTFFDVPYIVRVPVTSLATSSLNSSFWGKLYE